MRESSRAAAQAIGEHTPPITMPRSDIGGSSFASRRITKRTTSGDGNWHATERSAARGFRRVEVGMRVEPEHADANRFDRRSRPLQAGHHSRHRGHVANSPTVETIALVLRDDAAKWPRLMPSFSSRRISVLSGVGWRADADRGARSRIF